MAVMAMCVLLSCTEKKEEATLSGLMKSNFVSEVQGKPTALYVLKNQNGAEACVTNWGGRLVSVMVPDKNGKMTETVLQMASLHWMVLSTSFRRITTDIACMVVRKVTIRLFGMPNR